MGVGRPAVDHSPNTSDLQLGLGSRLLRFHCLIGDDGCSRAARAHIIEHDALEENKKITIRLEAKRQFSA